MNRRRFLSGALATTLGLVGVGNVAAADASTDEAGFVHPTGEQSLATGADQPLAGRTTFGDGVPVTVRVELRGDSPGIRRSDTTTAADGTFATSVDLSDGAAGAPYEATVSWYGIELATVSGELTTEATGVAFSHEGNALTLAPAPDQSLSVTGDLDEGTDVRLRVESLDPGAPFVERADATADGDGTAAASVDLSDLEPGTIVEATAFVGSSQVAGTVGLVRD